MGNEVFIVDTFTREIGCGNPAGVVIVEKGISDGLMQKIAFEMNQTDTVFIQKGKDQYSIRWFSPKREMSLCGHATMAASKVLFDKGEASPIVFEYQNGEIAIRKEADDSISMRFPEDDYTNIDIDQAYYAFFGISEIIACIYGKVTKKVILIVDSKTELKKIVPNFELMKSFSGTCVNGIGITKESDNKELYDFETRYFNPWFGVNEDPVTVSVHTVLSKYWSDRLQKNDLVGYQDSFRPGILKMLRDSGTVTFSGYARVFATGILNI